MSLAKELKAHIQQLADQAKAAAAGGLLASPAEKSRALLRTAEIVQAQRVALLEANQKDISIAQEKHVSAALLDRLILNDERIDAMIESLQQVAALDDPVASMEAMRTMPNGLQVGQMRVPLGVIGMIYESRPNVTIEAAALCLKSGNAVILRGGSEAFESNQLLVRCLQQGLLDAGLCVHLIQLVTMPHRDAVGMLLQASDAIDVIIPRGGRSLIERVMRETTIPVIQHLDGICHVYIDQDADTEQALAIAENAKTQRYGTCNTMETLLVHAKQANILHDFAALMQTHQVEVRGCKRSCTLQPEWVAATEEDWSSEYLAPIVSVKIVDSLNQAIDHINHYGSHHTDAIITQNYTSVRQFVRLVDSASVMVNASTRFADGFEYGLGAEIGISTNKLHVRGPVGLLGLTTQKYVVLGNGHIRR